MYEAGWGKKLNYVLAIGMDHCADVTWRYTRQGHLDEFQARRREITSSEVAGESIVQQTCQRLMANLKPKEREEVQKRLAQEAKELSHCRQFHEWTKEYGQGRISGSLEWRLARQEAGDNDSKEKAAKENETKAFSYSVETFLPLTSKDVSIAVQPYPPNPRESIVVSWTACAVGLKETLSVVVVDNWCAGCILQSKAFHSTEDLAKFLEDVPEYRIVAVQGQLPKEKINTKSLSHLIPGFQVDAIEHGVLFVGQKENMSGWTFCASFNDCPEGHRVVLRQQNVPGRDLSLRTLKAVQPTSVIGRLPGNWTNSSESEKRQGFLSYPNRMKCSGYSSKPGMPVYLLGETAFPLNKCAEEAESEWNTFLWWPTPMVPESDHGIVDTPTLDASLTVQVPIDTDFFHGLFGPTLRTKFGSKSTAEVLENSRLVGIYFTASWCGPCRSVTPILAEMYDVLKENHPSHGLEIVVVSSDRDTYAFENYYSKMPWAAVPFENVASIKANLSMRYGVRGIPFLVILDSVSGQVVVPGSASRQEVMGACQRGEAAIENLFQDWIGRLPAETKEIMSMLEVSCTEDRVESKDEDSSEVARYLSQSAKDSPATLPFEAATMSSSEEWEEECLRRLMQDGTSADMRQLIETTLKYLANARKQPWITKFRSFRLSNKIADRITCIPHSVSFLQSLGLEALRAENDFVLTFPLAANLDEIQEDLEAYLEEYQG